MRFLFIVSDTQWSARARAFVLAARGLAARGHEARIACTADCPVQVRAADARVPVLPMDSESSTAGTAWQLRGALKEQGADVVFVHTDSEHLAASSALRFAGGGGAVIRRVPPFATTNAGGRIANRLAPSGLLFTTDADRQAAGDAAGRLPAITAPLGVDLGEHDAALPVSRESMKVPEAGRVLACVHDESGRHRVLTALRTIALLAPRHPGLRLVIVGAERSEELRMHAAALGITPLVSFLGARPDELSVLKAADAGWIAADGDAAALAALDFMAARKAIIAERSPLMQHYVADGIAGVLLTPADPPTTAAAVSAFITGESQRVAMGNAGRSRVQREFTLDQMVDGFERAAQAALDRQGAAV